MFYTPSSFYLSPCPKINLIFTSIWSFDNHSSLEVFDHIPSSDVDALEDVHLGRRGRVRVVFRGGVADWVDEDVVIHLLGVGARESRGFANKP